MANFFLLFNRQFLDARSHRENIYDIQQFRCII